MVYWFQVIYINCQGGKFIMDKRVINERKLEAAANHQASIAASLKHRLDVARANDDSRLVEALEREVRQAGVSVG